MSDAQQAIINEFLVESFENLSNINEELTRFEKDPSDKELLNAIFRKIHTLKGSASFLGFSNLQVITHAVESILDFIRNDQLKADSSLIDLFLESFDACQAILKEVEATGKEGVHDYSDLTKKLKNNLEQAMTGDKAMSEDKHVPTAQEMIAQGSDDEEVVEEKSAAVPAAQTAAPNSQKLADSTVRVNVKLLDKIMNVVGELVINRNQILQYSKHTDSAELNRFAQQLNVITTELQTDIMTTRMQPVGNVFNKFERVVRDLARGQSKSISLEISGKETELDKTLIEVIKDPLTHLVRNCVDHGIESPEERQAAGKNETGKLSIKAFHEGGQVIIEIADDGKGIDTEAVVKKAVERGIFSESEVGSLSKNRILNVIFNPGFSTAAAVTNISGRGVGMDVVKSNIEKIGGGVEIDSEFGKGTSFRLKIPLTLAIVPALVVESGGETFAIHQKNLVELVMLDESEGSSLEVLHGNEFYRLRGELIPIVRLNKILNYETKSSNESTLNIIVLKAEGRVYGLIVDDVLDTQEIVVKPLSRKLKDINIYAGATIMGDGKVALIIDALGFYNLVENRAIEKTAEEASNETEVVINEDQQEVLLFKLGDGRIYGVPLALINRLEKFMCTSVESSGDQSLIRYRESSMPLLNLESLLHLEGESQLVKLKGIEEKFHCIVIDIQQYSFGLVVDSIYDIAMSESEIETNTVDREGLLGTLYINESLITLVDVHKIIESTNIGKKLFGELEKSMMRGKIILAEDSSLYRNVQIELFESAGLEVLVAKNGKEGCELFKSNSDVDLIVTDIEMPHVSGYEFAEFVRESNKDVPIIAVSTRISNKDKEQGIKSGFTRHLQKLNKVEVINTIKEFLG